MKHKINKVNANALKGDIVMDKKDIKKVVLAYSGGLDTSIIIPWLKENYNNCEVIAVSGDVGQGTELDGLEEKAIATGASKLYVLDLKDEYVEDYISHALRQAQIMKNTFSVHHTLARASQRVLQRLPKKRVLTLFATVAQARATTKFVLNLHSKHSLRKWLLSLRGVSGISPLVRRKSSMPRHTIFRLKSTVKQTIQRIKMFGTFHTRDLTLRTLQTSHSI